MFYNVALFLHILGALGIFSAVAIHNVCLIGMRRAQRIEQVRLLAEIARATGRSFVVLALLLFLPACYMVITAWSFGEAWILAGLGIFVLLAIVGSTLNKQQILAILRASQQASDGPLPATLRSLLDQPRHRVSERILIALLIGVVFLMTNKPDLLGTLETLGGVLILALVSLLPWRLSSRNRSSDKGEAQ